MVLASLALSIRGLFRQIRLAALPSRRRNSSSTDMETLTVMEDDRTVQSPLLLVPAVVGVGVAVVERERGDRGIERAVERGFMMSARMSSVLQPTVSRTAASKRKLEELEIGIAESSAAATSQVRARRESRDDAQQDSQVRARRESREDVLEGSVAESSGRERYDGGFSAPGEAQALDGETQMREEGGNEAIDADSMWEEEPGWNRASLEVTCEIAKFGSEKVETDEKAEESGGLEATGSSLSLAYVSSSGEPSGELSLSVLDTISERSGLDEDHGSRDGEIGKENEAEKARERERDSVIFMHEEELTSRRFGSLVSSIGAGHLVESSVGSIINTSTSGTGSVPSLGGGGSTAILSSSDASSTPAPAPGSIGASRLQFFVRTYLEGRTIVLHANASDTVESVHQQILLKTGLPVSEQRLIFCGRQLQQDQTLELCHVTKDATLHLVARMRSTALPHSWQLINDLVATIRRMCAVGDPQPPFGMKLMHSQDCVRAGVQEFLKMASKSVPVSEHMQVFQLAGATSALVMLLLSPVDSNRECAEESIAHFLQANEEYLPGHIHCHCAPVLLDFCKLLAKSAPHLPLYCQCRNALARLLDTVGIAHGSPYFNEAKAETIVHDFSPFVNELSFRLSTNLRWIARAYTVKETSLNFGLYMKEAKDFTAFVIPLCKAMEVCKGIDASGSANGGRNDGPPGPRVAPEIMDDQPDCYSLSFRAGIPISGEGRAQCRVSMEVETAKGMTLGVASPDVGSHGWLRTLFRELLNDISNCLETVGNVSERLQEVQGTGVSVSDDRERPLSCAPFLVVLKGLHAIAKLYEGAMEDLLAVLSVRHIALNVLIRQSRSQEDDFWLLEHKYLLDFESKRRLVMAMLPEPQDDHDERQEIVVHRSQLLTESFELLAYVEPEVLQGGISVEFATEEATGPGVLREWFSMICREIFNPQNALFLPCPNDRRRFFPNPASGVNPGHLTYFRFCGRVIALALMHRVQIDVVFALTFFKQLAGLPISWEDAKDADPFLYESCKKILEMKADIVDSDALGLTFVSEVEELGTRKSMELCQGGKDLIVNSENRKQFVELLVQRRLVASVADQVKSFSQGFADLLVNASHQQFLRALEPEDLDLMLYGKDRNICLDDWRAHTEYHDYTSSDSQIEWFWKVAEGMTPEQRRRLLFFSTSVTHLPAEGFAGLSSKFHIHRAHTDTSWLPTAHTCFYQLVLPAYPTFEIMHLRLHAITEVHIAEGFGFA